jgi:hypothetical protein
MRSRKTVLIQKYGYFGTVPHTDLIVIRILLIHAKPLLHVYLFFSINA